jgi:hypothetical protein
MVGQLNRNWQMARRGGRRVAEAASQVGEAATQVSWLCSSGPGVKHRQGTSD